MFPTETDMLYSLELLEPPSMVSYTRSARTPAPPLEPRMRQPSTSEYMSELRNILAPQALRRDHSVNLRHLFIFRALAP